MAAALEGIEINECGNVSKVKEAVKEGANEIGTVYYSDAYSVRDDVTVIAFADEALAGQILYPVAQVENKEASEGKLAATAEFLTFLQTDEVKAIFGEYMFLINE